MLKDLVIIRTDECWELFDGILDETQENTGHLLGKELILKNTLKKLEQFSFLPRQTQWIINYIFANPFQEKEGLIQSETREEFNNQNREEL